MIPDVISKTLHAEFKQGHVQRKPEKRSYGARTKSVACRQHSTGHDDWGMFSSTKGLFSSHQFQTLALCKKKIPCHIKLAIYAWSTKC